MGKSESLLSKHTLRTWIGTWLRGLGLTLGPQSFPSTELMYGITSIVPLVYFLWKFVRFKGSTSKKVAEVSRIGIKFEVDH